VCRWLLLACENVPNVKCGYVGKYATTASMSPTLSSSLRASLWAGERRRRVRRIPIQALWAGERRRSARFPTGIPGAAGAGRAVLTAAIVRCVATALIPIQALWAGERRRSARFPTGIPGAAGAGRAVLTAAIVRCVATALMTCKLFVDVSAEKTMTLPENNGPCPRTMDPVREKWPLPENNGPCLGLLCI
jgi:hypothetical protein